MDHLRHTTEVRFQCFTAELWHLLRILSVLSRLGLELVCGKLANELLLGTGLLLFVATGIGIE